MYDQELIREYYRRFRRWQQAAPHYENRHEGTTQHCHNCDADYSGNFCPVCGQRTGLGRPGYLVRDYISGRRQVSFPPVKMLVIICLFVVIVESVFHVKNDVVGLKFNVQEIDDIIGWVNSQKSWATLFLQSFYILPTWLVFRFAPGYPLPYAARGIFSASIPERFESSLGILWLLER